MLGFSCPWFCRQKCSRFWKFLFSNSVFLDIREKYKIQNMKCNGMDLMEEITWSSNGLCVYLFKYLFNHTKIFNIHLSWLTITCLRVFCIVHNNKKNVLYASVCVCGAYFDLYINILLNNRFPLKRNGLKLFFTSYYFSYIMPYIKNFY